MTDMINALTVVLAEDVRDDDCERLCQAIRCMRGVLNVNKNVTDITARVAQDRARHELTMRLLDVVRE